MSKLTEFLLKETPAADLADLQFCQNKVVLPQKCARLDQNRLQRDPLCMESVVCRREFLAQRRKGTKRCRVPKGFLCAFAPLREK